MNFIIVVIIACEIGFWVFVTLGLLARYVLRLPRLGAVLLIMTPVVDLVLLAAVIINLQTGGTATFFHALAALYLGISIAYGHKMITWADARFAHRFASGPAPSKAHGLTYTKERWKDVARTGAAAGIAAAILWLLIALADNPASATQLQRLIPVLAIWFTIDLIVAIIYTAAPKKKPASTTS